MIPASAPVQSSRRFQSISFAKVVQLSFTCDLQNHCVQRDWRRIHFEIFHSVERPPLLDVPPPSWSLSSVFEKSSALSKLLKSHKADAM